VNQQRKPSFRVGIHKTKLEQTGLAGVSSVCKYAGCLHRSAWYVAVYIFKRVWYDSMPVERYNGALWMRKIKDAKWLNRKCVVDSSEDDALKYTTGPVAGFS